jgi:ABC-type multidrug transport system fused ATPase/permease subunit
MKKTSLLRYAVAGNQGTFLFLLITGLLTNLVMSTTDPLLTKTLIDNVIRHNFRAFALLALAVVLFAGLMRGALLLYALACQRLQNRIAQTLTLKMLAKYYATSYSQISHSSNGYFVSRIYDEPAKVAQGAIGVWLAACTSVVTFLGSLTISLLLSWRITLVLAVIVPLLYYLARRFSPRIRNKTQAENEGEAKLRELLGRATESYKTVKLFDLFPAMLARVSESLQFILDTAYSRARISRSYQTLSTIFLSLAEALVFIAAGYAVLKGEMTLGGLFGFMSAFWKLINAGAEIIKQIPEMSRQEGLIQRLRDFESLPDEQPVRGVPVSSGANVVELTGVQVTLGSQPILENVELTVENNERVLVIGPNGSGKTTMANLLAQFIEASDGSVNVPSRSRISALLAPFHFVPGTLLDNVNYARLSEDKRRMFAALVDQLDLRERQNTDLASTLSEGEKRKCQVLMTLLKDADLYIFDEPLTNIDTESKRLILQTIMDYTRRKSLIAIMHGDSEYWSLFDRVVEMRQISAPVCVS